MWYRITDYNNEVFRFHIGYAAAAMHFAVTAKFFLSML